MTMISQSTVRVDVPTRVAQQPHHLPQLHGLRAGGDSFVLQARGESEAPEHAVGRHNILCARTSAAGVSGEVLVMMRGLRD